MFDQAHHGHNDQTERCDMSFKPLFDDDDEGQESPTEKGTSMEIEQPEEDEEGSSDDPAED